MPALAPAETKVIYGGSTVETPALPMALEEFLTVQTIVQAVGDSARGGSAPLLLNGPVLWSAAAVSNTAEESTTCVRAPEGTASGTLPAPVRVPCTASVRSITGF